VCVACVVLVLQARRRPYGHLGCSSATSKKIKGYDRLIGCDCALGGDAAPQAAIRGIARFPSSSFYQRGSAFAIAIGCFKQWCFIYLMVIFNVFRFVCLHIRMEEGVRIARRMSRKAQGGVSQRPGQHDKTVPGHIRQKEQTACDIWCNSLPLNGFWPQQSSD
jgi:hypothetical protein